jgi:hypothetical protein
VFDPLRPYLYATDYAAKKLYIVSLRTGFIERQFSFLYSPERMAITPDGSRLFVALLTRPHSSYWWDEDGHEGYIASFDLAKQVKDREFHITEDPYDLVATSDGRLIASSGSGQWTYVRVFDATTGLETGPAAFPVYQSTRLALHPSEQRVYGADNGLSPSDIERYDLLPNGGITLSWDSPYHGDHRMSGNVWVTPNGERLITRGGDVFTSAVDRASDMRYVQGLSTGAINDLAFDSRRNVIFTGEGSSVRYYNLQSFLEIGSQPLAGVADFVGVQGKTVFAAEVETNHTRIETFAHPALAPAYRQAGRPAGRYASP